LRATALGEKTYSANTWIALCGLDVHYSRNDRTSISLSHRLNVYMYASKNDCVYAFVILRVSRETAIKGVAKCSSITN